MILSCLILTKNKGKTIFYVLESVKNMVDEIVVVDSGSTDNTLEIVQNYTDKIYKRSLDSFSKQRNYGIEKCSGDYILLLDSDEIVSENFSKVKKYLNKGYQSLSFPRYNLISVDPLEYVITIHHYRNWQTRIIKNNGVAKYGDDIVHETLKNYRPRLRCAEAHVFHLDFLVHSYEVRAKKVEFYNNMSPGTGYPECYLFEDYPYRTALTLEKPAQHILDMLCGDENLRTFKYVSNRSFFTQITQMMRWNAYKLLTRIRAMVGV